MSIKQFWNYISNKHLVGDMEMSDLLRAKKLNQYAFLTPILFFFNGIRDLFYGILTNFYVFTISGTILLMLFFFTRLRFKDYFLFAILIIFCGIIFLLSSSLGFDNGISLYYLSILLAATFLFNNRKNHKYSIFIYILVLILFYIENVNDFQIFNFLQQNTLVTSSKELRIHTFIQVSLFIVFNGYFISIENNTIAELCEQKLWSDKIIANLNELVNESDQGAVIEDVVRLAVSNDIAFLPHFKQVFPSFYDNLISVNPDLTVDEFKFCAFLKLGFTTKDIANCNNLAVRSVQTRKNRLRKSFNLSSQEDLYNWIDKF